MGIASVWMNFARAVTREGGEGGRHTGARGRSAEAGGKAGTRGCAAPTFRESPPRPGWVKAEPSKPWTARFPYTARGHREEEGAAEER